VYELTWLDSSGSGDILSPGFEPLEFIGANNTKQANR
jgi:hypothetical protein